LRKISPQSIRFVQGALDSFSAPHRQWLICPFGGSLDGFIQIDIHGHRAVNPTVRHVSAAPANALGIRLGCDLLWFCIEAESYLGALEAFYMLLDLLLLKEYWLIDS